MILKAKKNVFNVFILVPKRWHSNLIILHPNPYYTEMLFKLYSKSDILSLSWDRLLLKGRALNDSF